VLLVAVLLVITPKVPTEVTVGIIPNRTFGRVLNEKIGFRVRSRIDVAGNLICKIRLYSPRTLRLA